MTGVRGWAAVLAVTLGVFALMTSELLPVGLLTPVASALHVGEGAAGLMVTVPGLVAGISAPLITVALGRIDRRIVLAVLVGLVGVANLAAASATGLGTVLVARFLIGVAVGGFWSLAAGIAMRLVPARHVARATAVIFAGTEAATVFGVPTGTLLGDLAGWRSAFAAVGVLGLVALGCIVVLIPPLPAEGSIGLAVLPGVLRGSAGLRAGLAITFLIITGHFVAYTFVRPILVERGVGGDAVGPLLLLFGVAGLAGNFLAGALVTRWPRGTVLGIAGGLTAAMIGATGPVPAPALLILWGLAYGAVPVTLQTWILRSAPDAADAAGSLFVAVFNLSIAVGALLGGLAVEAVATSAVLWIGGGLTALTGVVLAGRRPVGAPVPSSV
ncbi:MFS transporter [Actinoplanes ianthinogenes]|uniref:MFS transporter n=1 Tax=Actinoplanes ianthinogenes TaxID=122358 RepID=A0ABM7MA28_9ACTN|nr:MFS transporter [Actinoplanes ianthinogenes]BCJ48502.1 MFS transporter [Actinoplanes ianthinogenes]GGR36948.1 MFS transporter [Actinoplanes ianthinogenes]